VRASKENQLLWGVGIVSGLALGVLAMSRMTQSQSSMRPPDDAPGLTAKRRNFGGYAVSGNAVTINKPRQELYAFWRDFQNLATFMDNIESVRLTGEDRSVWKIKAPAGQTVEVETQIVTDRPDELIAWRSVEGSDIDTEGRVTFRDGGPRGTVVEAIIAYKPPAGAMGKWVAKLFQREPNIQGRQELKRLKMLMETGEIAIAKPKAQDAKTDSDEDQ
jgi:uncharacterized membrane protein